MAAKPWETRLMEQQSKAETAEAMATPNKQVKSPETIDVKVRRNNVTTRVSARPPHMSSSSPGCEFKFHDESSGSSSLCTTTTPASGTTGLVSEETGGNDNSSSKTNKMKPSYMSLTESTKAKRRTNRGLRQSMDEFQFMKNSGLFTGEMKGSTVSDPSSVSFSKPLGGPTRFEKQRVKDTT